MNWERLNRDVEDALDQLEAARDLLRRVGNACLPAPGQGGGRVAHAPLGQLVPRIPGALVALCGVMALGLFLAVVASMRTLLVPGGNPWAWLPVVFLPMAFLAAVAVEVTPRSGCVRAFVVAMGLAVLIGLAGTVLHMAAHGLLGPHLSHWLRFGSWMGDPPIFAPMQLSLMGAVGGFALALAAQYRAAEPAASWRGMGVPGGVWRTLAACGGVGGLAGMLLEASPARAYGVLLILAATAAQGALAVGILTTAPAAGTGQCPFPARPAARPCDAVTTGDDADGGGAEGTVRSVRP